MNKMVRVYDELCAGTLFHELPSELDHIPPNMTNFVSFFLKHVLNCKVYVASHEADEEIIDYVDENGNAIIFSDDTDFVVSYIDADVISAKHFNVHTMTTRMYDRDELYKHLNLSAEELPYLAVLAGNDVINQQAVKPFHRKLMNWPRSRGNIPYDILMENLADYINCDLSSHVSSNNHMRTICKEMFGNGLQTAFLRRAYKAYMPNQRSSLALDDSPWSQVLITAQKLMKDVILPVSAWGVLSAYIYESNPVLENYRKTASDEDASECPCATITRPLRQRWYGILLYERRNVIRPVVEWCAENLQSYKKFQLVFPEYPSVFHPGLLSLWDQNFPEMFYLEKCGLFFNAVSPNIESTSIFEWMSLPDDLIIPTAVCFYLLERRFLMVLELRALLVTLVVVKYHSSNNLTATWSGSPNIRAVEISAAFSRTFSIMFSIFATCGYPVPLSRDTAHIKFEPIVFQRIFEEVVFAGKELGELYPGQEFAKKMLEKMKKIIYQSL